MKEFVKYRIDWFLRSFFILVSLFIFQYSIIPVSASPSILESGHHTGISETYVYVEIEGSVFAEVGLTGRLSRVLSVKEVRPDYEVLADVASVAARSSNRSFSSMMDAAEAARYNKYWSNYAPKQVTPGTTRLDWVRVSGRTGRLENSRVIYDNYGRQIYRVDFSNHLRPSNHSIPHLHQYQYGSQWSNFGKESVFNFFGQ